MKGQTFQALGIAPFRIAKSVPTEALKALLALQGRSTDSGRARRDPGGGPARQRRTAASDAPAGQPLRRAGGEGGRDPRGRRPSRGPLTQRTASEIAAHLGSPSTTLPTCRRRPAASPTSPTAGCTCRAASRRRETHAPRCCRRCRAASWGTPSRAATPSSSGSGWRRTTSPVPCSSRRRTSSPRCRTPSSGGRSPSKTSVTHTRCRMRRRRTGSRTSRRGTSTSPCTSSRCMSRAPSPRRTRTTT